VPASAKECESRLNDSNGLVFTLGVSNGFVLGFVLALGVSKGFVLVPGVSPPFVRTRNAPKRCKGPVEPIGREEVTAGPSGVGDGAGDGVCKSAPPINGLTWVDPVTGMVFLARCDMRTAGREALRGNALFISESPPTPAPTPEASVRIAKRTEP
jgi:hypothetical protein